MERFEQIYYDFQKATLNCEEAAMILGVSSRHFLRLRERYEEEGLAGLKDRRVGGVCRNAVLAMLRLARSPSCTANVMTDLMSAIFMNLPSVTMV